MVTLVDERCVACGLCEVLAPDIFTYDKEGIVLLKQQPTTGEQFKMCTLAAKRCPAHAIIYSDN